MPKRYTPEELAYLSPDIPQWRRTLSDKLVGFISGSFRFIIRHWLGIANYFNFLFLAGTFLAPLLVVAGQVNLAKPLYEIYSLVCLQRGGHSINLFGVKMGMEVRMVAIYGGFVLAGIYYNWWRNRAGPVKFFGLLSWKSFLLLSLPLLLDVFSQTFELRESNTFWRVLTGFIFGVGTIWFFYPRFNKAAASLKSRSGI